MFRIHLAARDVATLRLLPSIGPLGETLHSLRVLRRQPDDEALSRWRLRTRAALDPGLRRLPAAATGERSCLDLDTIARGGNPSVERDFAAATRAILTADPALVQAEVDFYAGANGHVPKEIRGLADAWEVRRRLVYQIEAYNRSAIAPIWNILRAHHTSDRVSRARTLLEQGVEGLLSTLHPRLHWSAPTLSLLDSADGEIHLEGRGLALAPSFFLRKPALVFDLGASDGPAVLIYPVPLSAHGSADIWTAADAERALAKLLGRSRALILMAIASGVGSTGDIARRIGTTAPAVSQHIKVLRDARLIVTHRDGATARHSVTARGLDLLGRRDADS